MERNKRKMRNKNRGSMTVEAALAMPLFLFAMLALYHIHQCHLAQAAVYEACAEAAEYTAEYAFVGNVNPLIPQLCFSKYIDDEARIKRYVAGGASGVSFLLTHTEDDYLVLEASYRLRVSVPFFPVFSGKRHVKIRQRLYVGDTGGSENESEDETREKYCYVTDNREVYHLSRSCTHLQLSVHAVSDRNICENMGLVPCAFCGGMGGSTYLVTDEGNCYHKNPGCSGLKRTVYRVRRSEVNGIPPCGRCGLEEGD